jgi:hypothetical protein
MALELKVFEMMSNKVLVDDFSPLKNVVKSQASLLQNVS